MNNIKSICLEVGYSASWYIPPPKKKEMQRQVSRTACELYGRIDTSLRALDETKQAQCALSLANPSEVKEHFKWIAVPAGDGANNLYSLDDFKVYFENYPYQWQIIPDPMRNHTNLRFMNKRMKRLLAFDADIANLLIVNITQDFKERVAQEFFSISKSLEWLYNEKKTQDLSVLCGLTTLENINGKNLVHKNFSTPLEAEIFMQGKPDGTYLLRLSTNGSVNGSGDCTVFTVTMMYEGNPQHVRLVDMHGVGIYVATSGPKGDLPRADINYKDLLEKSSMKEILKRINYAEPRYACLSDCLLDFQARGFLKIDMIMPVV